MQRRHILFILGLLCVMGWVVPMGAQNTDIRPTVMLVDVSGSMSGADSNGRVKIVAAREAGALFVDTIIAEQQNPQAVFRDLLSLITFSTSANTLHNLTEDYNAVRNDMLNLNANGGTNIYDAFVGAIAQFNSLAGQRIHTPAVILLTDGQPTSSSTGASTDDALRAELLALAPTFAQFGACLYAVPVGDPNASPGGDNFVDVVFLQQLVQAVGCGDVFFVDDVSNLAQTYITIRLNIANFNVINNQRVNVIANQNIVFQDVTVTDEESLRFDLYYIGSVVDLNVTDPAGRRVDASYPGASLVNLNSYTQLVIDNPQAGIWSVRGFPSQVNISNATAELIVSTRPGTLPQAPILTDSGGDGDFILLLLGAILIIIFFVVLFVIMATANRDDPNAPAYGAPAYGAPPVFAGGGAPAGGGVVMPQARLVVQTGELTGRTVYISSPRFLIGSSSSNALKMRSSKVSRHHAEILYENGQFVIVDLNSRNGTYVNNRPIASHPLHQGDRVRIGSTEFVFWVSG